MIFFDKYKILKNHKFRTGKYTLVPIRYEDRFDIMKWRNEQLYHLRQEKLLADEDQDNYFENVIAKLFSLDKPPQILFSYLEDEKCIGYGGLVHINWKDKNAELSFVINTALEKEQFNFHWKTYLGLIEKVAFEDLNLYKVYTYAFDLRPRLYEALEEADFKKEAVLKEHCFINGKFKNVVIHSKWKKNTIGYRLVKEEDIWNLYEWANEEQSRENSFYTNEISKEEHKNWFYKKLKDQNSTMVLAHSQDDKIAIIRFDYKNDATVIGINIDKKYRGKGLGSKLIKESSTEYLEEINRPILAYVRSSNLASIKVFEKAGYVYFHEDNVNGIACKVYKYER